MDPVAQVLAQQQGGSAEGQGFGQFYVEGQKLGQEQQRIGLENRRVQIDEKLAPFREQLLANQAAQEAQALVVAVDKASSITDRNDSLPQFFALERKFIDSPKGHADPALLDEFKSLTARYPHVLSVPGPAQDIYTAVRGTGMYLQQIAQAEAAQKAFANTSEYVSELDSQGHIRFGQRKDQDVEDLKQMLSVFRQVTEMHRLDQGERRLTQGDTRLGLNARTQGLQIEPGDKSQQADGSANMFSAMMDFLKAKKATRTNSAPTPDSSIGLPSELPSPVATPDAPNPSTVTPAAPQSAPVTNPAARKGATFTPVERPLQAGEAGKLQAQHVEAQQGLFQISQLEDQIKQHPEAFGPLSEFRSWAEVVRGLTDNNADATVNAIKEQAGTTFVSLARTLRPDSGNMSHFELNELKKIGDLRAAQNVPSVALAKADVIKAMIIAKDLRFLQTLKPDDTKRKADDFLLTQIRPSDLKGIISSGLLKKPDADRWHELYQEKLKGRP